MITNDGSIIDIFTKLTFDEDKYKSKFDYYNSKTSTKVVMNEGCFEDWYSATTSMK